MGYTISAYLVGLEELRITFGSRDRELLQEVEHTFARRLEQDETPHEALVIKKGATKGRREMVPRPVPTLRQALADIIKGTVNTAAEAPAQYTYAMELLCAKLGQRLDNEPFVQINGLGILNEFAGLEPLANNSRLPLPIPNLPLPHGIPAVTYMTTAEVPATLSRVRLVEPAQLCDNPKWQGWDDDYIYAAWEMYRSWLEQAQHAHQDVVAFLL